GGGLVIDAGRGHGEPDDVAARHRVAVDVLAGTRPGKGRLAVVRIADPVTDQQQEQEQSAEPDQHRKFFLPSGETAGPRRRLKLKDVRHSLEWSALFKGGVLNFGRG